MGRVQLEDGQSRPIKPGRAGPLLPGSRGSHSCKVSAETRLQEAKHKIYHNRSTEAQVLLNSRHTRWKSKAYASFFLLNTLTVKIIQTEKLVNIDTHKNKAKQKSPLLCPYLQCLVYPAPLTAHHSLSVKDEDPEAQKKQRGCQRVTDNGAMAIL